MKTRLLLILALVLAGSAATASEQRLILTGATNWREIRGYDWNGIVMRHYADAVGTRRLHICYVATGSSVELNSTLGTVMETVVRWYDLDYAGAAYFARYSSLQAFTDYMTLFDIQWTTAEVAGALPWVVPDLPDPFGTGQILSPRSTPFFNGTYSF